MRPLPLRRRRRAAGLTLLELMIVVGTVGVLAAFSTTQFMSAREAVRSAGAQSDLMESLVLAVKRATFTGSEAVLCPANGRSCLATNDWTGGWVVFDDVDADRQVGAAERVVKSVAAPGGNVRLRTSVGRTRLVFQPNGGNSGSNATFVLCDGRGPDKAVAIVLSNEGRIRTTKPAAADAQNCVRTP